MKEGSSAAGPPLEKSRRHPSRLHCICLVAKLRPPPALDFPTCVRCQLRLLQTRLAVFLPCSASVRWPHHALSHSLMSLFAMLPLPLLVASSALAPRRPSQAAAAQELAEAPVIQAVNLPLLPASPTAPRRAATPAPTAQAPRSSQRWWWPGGRNPCAGGSAWSCCEAAVARPCRNLRQSSR